MTSDGSSAWVVWARRRLDELALAVVADVLDHLAGPAHEVALAGQDDDTRLVTGNLRHYPVSPIVVTPAQMIAIIEERFSQS